MEFTDEEVAYLIDATMVFMHEIDALNHDDDRLPDLQHLLIRLMFTDCGEIVPSRESESGRRPDPAPKPGGPLQDGVQVVRSPRRKLK